MSDRRPMAILQVALLILALSILAPAGIDAQYDRPPPPAAYALVGATVVAADGSSTEDVTVVVRGGFVEAIEEGLEPPADARVLEGEDLRVYPGLVDAWGRAEVEYPERPRPEEVTAWNPSRLAQGFTPHLRTADHLTATGETLRERRDRGVLASGVFPTRGFVGGLGAVLLHRPDAEEPRELIVRPEAGLAMSFEGSPGGYPSTLFGVIAHLRQSFSDAQRQALLEQEYEENPNRVPVPTWDPDHEVLRRVAGAGLPAYFAASDAEDIRRVLGLAYEMGFSPVIVGGGEAWRLAEELSTLDVPVLVSLDFPEPREWDPEEDEDEELEPGAERERQRLENLYANPARLAEAGVSFAFTSGGGAAELREGVRTVMEYGLSEEDALQALTSTPAELLGIASVSRPVPGYAATFIVTDGPLFAEDASIVYTFVEGVLEEVEADAGLSGEPDEPPEVDVSGTWRITVRAEGGTAEYEATLEQTGTEVSGTAVAPDGSTVRIPDGVVSGDEVTLELRFEGAPDVQEGRLTATVEGDRMEGSGSGTMGDFEVTAVREPDAGAGADR